MCDVSVLVKEAAQTEKAQPPHYWYKMCNSASICAYFCNPAIDQFLHINSHQVWVFEVLASYDSTVSKQS